MSDKITYIHSRGRPAGQLISEVWRQPDILWAFTRRDLRIRYAQTYLGFLWSLAQPIFGLMAVFVLFFKLAGINSGPVPYPLFALSGLIFWNYFYFTVTQIASGFVHAQAMIKKVYFPRLSLPLSKLITGSIDWAVGLVLLIAALLYYQWSLTGLGWAFLALLLTAASGLGAGLIISALSLRYRDLQQILPFVLQLLFFLSPVAYPSALFEKLLPESLLWLTYLNPVTGILELLRAGLFDMPLSPWWPVSLVLTAVLLIGGLWLFGRTERKLADWI